MSNTVPATTRPTRRRIYFDPKWILILGIVLFMVIFQIFPILYLVVKAFFPEGTFSLNTFERLYTYEMNWGALTNTLIAAFATMVLGTLLAFPLAWLVGRTNMYGKKFFRSLFVLTYMVPPYVGAMAWLRLLNRNVGTINIVIRAIFNMDTNVGPLNIYTLAGMIWVLTTFYYPYAFITLSRAMEKMDPSLEEAARVSGASPLRTVFTITLPMMTPSLIAGALLVFVCAMSCYGIPSIIGAPGKVHTVTTRIVEYMGLGAEGINDATGLAAGHHHSVPVRRGNCPEAVHHRVGQVHPAQHCGSWQVAHAHDRAGKPVCLHRDPGALRHDYRHLLQKEPGQGPV